MTTTNDVTSACPSCGRADSIDLSDGTRLCLNCRTEWDPKHPATMQLGIDARDELDTEDRIDTAEILRATTAADVLGPDLSPEETWRDHMGLQLVETEPSPLLGLFVTLPPDHAVEWLVIEDDGGALVKLRDSTGTETLVDRDMLALDVRYDDDDEGTTDATPSDDEPIVGVIASVASLVLTVGAEAVADDDDRTLLNPRIGWLPPPASDIPEVEQGAAYAVALLIKLFGLDRQQVLDIASNMMAGAAEVVAETETGQ